MSADFRKRSPIEYFQILKRRKWLILMPVVAVFPAVLYIVQGLPNLYESTTYLTISPPKISEKVAPSLTEDLSKRLESINQTVTSRTSLEPMIVKYGLFEQERAAGTSTDQILEKMKSRIEIDLERADDDKVLGVRISYRDRTPEITQQITAALAGNFVVMQKSESTESAETTKEFIENQLSQAKANLDSLEQQRISIMTQNVDALPESGQGLIAQLAGLRQREQTISKDKETLTTELGRVQDSIRSLNSQIRLIENFGEKETEDAVGQASRVEDTPAYGQLIQKRAELNARLENLKKQYREKHPDIIKTQTDINKINDELQELVRNNDKRVKVALGSSSRKADLQKQSMTIERQKVESQAEQIQRHLQEKNEEMIQNSRQIGLLETKLNTIPSVKVQLEGLNNQYGSAKVNYEELMKKYTNAQQQVQVASDSQGETIRVVDPANLPQVSVNASKKKLFSIFGGIAGLILGLGLAAVLEAPGFLKLKNVADAEYYTGLPVWAAVPPLLTKQELSQQKSRHLLAVMGGLIGTVASIPLLVFVLQTTRIFERLS